MTTEVNRTISIHQICNSYILSSNQNTININKFYWEVWFTKEGELFWIIWINYLPPVNIMFKAFLLVFCWSLWSKFWFCGREFRICFAINKSKWVFRCIPENFYIPQCVFTFRRQTDQYSFHQNRSWNKQRLEVKRTIFKFKTWF